MMNRPASLPSTRQLQWFAEPDGGHIVHFYPYDSALITSLAEFISTGLKNNETCIVVSTSYHLRNLEKQLVERNIDTLQVSNKQYITADAEEMLAKFMVNGLPDYELYLKSVGSIVAGAVKRGQPVRIFGEMVALLWREYNLRGAIQLEEHWNKLAKDHDFSLYCAYPEIHFDRSVHSEALAEISHCHTSVTHCY